MEATIKETVKNIFKTNKFEDALDLTRNLRGEYIHEFGTKSWNALVVYYKNANIIPETVIAEPEPEYPSSDEDVCETETSDDNAKEEANEIPSETEDGNIQYESSPDVETVEYMLYQNDGDRVEWYGHYVNYANLKVGDTGMMVRMNNLGVGNGKVLATSQMTMAEIGEFHKCYAVIRTSVTSDARRVTLFKRAFDNLQIAMKDPAYSIKTTSKAKCDFVLNYSVDE